jgi:hypothetical protein
MTSYMIAPIQDAISKENTCTKKKVDIVMSKKTSHTYSIILIYNNMSSFAGQICTTESYYAQFSC